MNQFRKFVFFFFSFFCFSVVCATADSLIVPSDCQSIHSVSMRNDCTMYARCNFPDGFIDYKFDELNCNVEPPVFTLVPSVDQFGLVHWVHQ
jgi:hypothetical protein